MLTSRSRESQQNRITVQSADKQKQRKSAKQNHGENADKQKQKKSAKQNHGANADKQKQKKSAKQNHGSKC